MYEGQSETIASKFFLSPPTHTHTLTIPSLILDCSDNLCDSSVSMNGFVCILCVAGCQERRRAATECFIMQVGILSYIYSNRFFPDLAVLLLTVLCLNIFRWLCLFSIASLSGIKNLMAAFSDALQYQTPFGN